jgi:hypothetical protein
MLKSCAPFIAAFRDERAGGDLDFEMGETITDH